MKTKKKGVIRNRVKISLLREIADMGRTLKRNEVPQKKLSRLERNKCNNHADIRLEDIHARISLIAEAVRRGKMIGAAYEVGIARGIFLGYFFAQKEFAEENSKGGEITTTVF